MPIVRKIGNWQLQICVVVGMSSKINSEIIDEHGLDEGVSKLDKKIC